MFKSIKKLFCNAFAKKEENLESRIKEIINPDPSYYYDPYKKILERESVEYDKQKSDWEIKNDLAKRIDACNLGMTKTAFQGTYEEYLKSRCSGSGGIFDLQNLQYQQYQQLCGGQMNPYHQPSQMAYGIFGNMGL